jgi:hypothetical protein
VGTQSLLVSATGSFADGNAATGKSVSTVYTLADGLSGGLASNYTLANATLSGTISAKALTVSNTTVANKVYNGDLLAVVTPGTLGGLVTGQTLLLAASASFTDKNVGSGKNVNVSYSLSNGSGLAANYTLANAVLTAAITAKPLSISGSTVASKVYDAGTTATVSAGSVTGYATNESLLGVTATGSFANANAATGKDVSVVYMLADAANGTALASNYSLAGQTLSTGVITAKPLSIVGSTVADKTYNASATATISPGTLFGLIGTQTLGVSATGSFADANAAAGKSVTAVYALTNGLNGGLASNYTLASATLSGTINPQSLTP